MALVVLGCGSAPERDPCNPSDLGGCILEEVELDGAEDVDHDELSERLATAESSHLLGGVFEDVPVLGILDAVTVEYERFDRFVLQRDLDRVRRYYRRKGYYHANVRAGRVTPLPEERVAVEIVIDPGPLVTIRSLEIDWPESAMQVEGPVLFAVTRLKSNVKVGDPLDEDVYEELKVKFLRALTDLGHAYGKVEGQVDVDLADNAADVRFAITLGPKCDFGPIAIEGNGDLPEFLIRSTLGFKEGDSFSTDAIDSAEQALADLNVFASTEFVVERSPEGEPPNTKVPIVVKLEPAKLSALKFGVGAEAGDRVEFHTLSGWENRNLFGLMDRFYIDAQPGMVFYPLKLTNFTEEPPFLEFLPHFRARSGYEIPVPFEPRTTAFTSAEFNLARPRNAETPDDPEPDDNILGYREYVGRLGLSRRFFKGVFFLRPSINIQIEDPFSYNLEEPPTGFRAVTITYLATFVELDFRKNRGGQRDPVNPHRGVYLATNAELAGFFLGGDADDVKIEPEFRGYLPISRDVVVAFRLGTGFILTDNYGDVLDNPVDIDQLRADGDSTLDEQLRAGPNFDRQRLELRGLYSGGPSSNRGYGYNEIAPYAVLDVDGNRLTVADAIGGRTLWEASLEVRFPIAGNWTAAWFTDASDVTAGRGQFRLDHPHLSTGVGIRYNTPVGPLRIDVGYRIPYLQVIGEPEVSSCIGRNEICPALVVDEGDPGDFLGLPVAVSIAIGESF